VSQNSCERIGLESAAMVVSVESVAGLGMSNLVDTVRKALVR
jgi:hypothetical protein